MERDPTGVDTQWLFVAILQAFFSRAAIVNAHCKDGREEDRSIMAGAVAINSVCLPRRRVVVTRCCLPNSKLKSNNRSPRRLFFLTSVYSGLNEVRRIRVSDPHDFESAFSAVVLNPDVIPGTHMASDTRKQRSRNAYTAGKHVLTERQSGCISARDGDPRSNGLRPF